MQNHAIKPAMAAHFARHYLCCAAIMPGVVDKTIAQLYTARESNRLFMRDAGEKNYFFYWPLHWFGLSLTFHLSSFKAIDHRHQFDLVILHSYLFPLVRCVFSLILDISTTTSIRMHINSAVFRSIMASVDAIIAIENGIARQEAQKRSILVEQSIESLRHASQCNDPLCTFPSCSRKKLFLEHVKNCRRQALGRCIDCRQVVKLFHYSKISRAQCTISKT